MNERVIEGIGESVREARKSRRLSQESLAYRVGVEQTEISKIERGALQPSLDKAMKIAEALGLEADAFLIRGD